VVIDEGTGGTAPLPASMGSSDRGGLAAPPGGSGALASNGESPWKERLLRIRRGEELAGERFRA
jgi:hypothetical protein